MTPQGTELSPDQSDDRPHDYLVLRSLLSDMARLPVWIDNLSARYSIPKNIQFAIDVCLEEVVSNVIRHGYAAVQDGKVVVHFAEPRDNHFEFVVEDEAPHFNPLDAPEPSTLDSQKEALVGGRGILLLRRFASAVAYEALPTGNRLTLSFSAVNVSP